MDGEVTVEYVVDPWVFIVSTDASQNQITRRLQTITTNASNIDEIQIVRLYNGGAPISHANYLEEIQTFTCIASGGSFKFRLDNDLDPNKPDTGAFEDTANIAYDATLADVKASLEALATVEKVAFDGDDTAVVCSGTPIQITFTTTGRQGDIHELQIISSLMVKTLGGSNTSVTEIQQLVCEANTGDFKLSFSTSSPVPSSTHETISFDAASTTKSDLISALNNLPTIDSVSLGSGENGTDLICSNISPGTTTLINMDDIPNYKGNVPNLVVVAGGIASDVVISQHTVGQAPIEGTFIIQWQGTNTTEISVSASASVVQAALIAARNTLDGNIAVTSTIVSALTNQRTWTIDFINKMSNQEQPNVIAIGNPEECQTNSACQIRGNDAKVIVCQSGISNTDCSTSDSIDGNSLDYTVTEERKGQSGLSGSFTLTYGSETTAKINVDEVLNYLVVEAALESLSNINDVHVQRVSEAHSWRISFIDTLNGGDIPAMSIDYSKIEGTGHYGRSVKLGQVVVFCCCCTNICSTIFICFACAHFLYRVCTNNQNDQETYTRAGVTYTAQCYGQSITGNTLGGTFKLSFQNESTGDIPFDATDSKVQEELRNLFTTNNDLTVTREKLEDKNGDGVCDESKKETCEEGSCGCQGDQQNGYRWYVDFQDDEVVDSLGYQNDLTGTSSNNVLAGHALQAFPTIEIASRYLGPTDDSTEYNTDCPKVLPSKTCLDKFGKELGTMVRFPDSLDCGLGKVACFMTGPADTDSCCADPSFRNGSTGAQNWGVCPGKSFAFLSPLLCSFSL